MKDENIILNFIIYFSCKSSLNFTHKKMLFQKCYFKHTNSELPIITRNMAKVFSIENQESI